MTVRFRPTRIRLRTSPSSQLQPKAPLAAALLGAAVLLAQPLPARAVTAAANISLSGSALTFNVTDSTQQHMAATPITVTGQITTKSNGTGGSIALLSPADITGTGGGILKISYFSMTCAGGAQTGQTFVASSTPLSASSTTGCATYAAGYDSTLLGGINFTLSLFLDDRTLDDDSYPATNFTVVATAT